MRLSLPQVCRNLALGAKSFGAMLNDGELSPTHAWVGVSGALKYVQAVASGDEATSAVYSARTNACAGCLSCKLDDASGEYWCGKPFEVVAGESCGCIIEGKAAVASETCPRGLWPV